MKRQIVSILQTAMVRLQGVIEQRI